MATEVKGGFEHLIESSYPCSKQQQYDVASHVRYGSIVHVRLQRVESDALRISHRKVAANNQPARTTPKIQQL